MIKYTECNVVFREIPNKVTLAINLSGCPFKCKGCHSSYLREDIGEKLDFETIDTLIQKYAGIECVCFMGGDAFIEELNLLVKHVKSKHNLLVGWYSGRDTLSIEQPHLINYLDYLKIGSYKEELGPLDSVTTNQRLYKINHVNEFYDITKQLQKV